MTTFVTGFPGFLGSALVDRLVAKAPGEADVTCLVQPKYRSVAEDRTEAIEGSNGAPGAVDLVEGDIAEPDLVHRVDRGTGSLDGVERHVVVLEGQLHVLDRLVELDERGRDSVGSVERRQLVGELQQR